MISAREQIAATLMTMLTATFAGVPVERNRGAALSSFPFVVLREFGQEVTNHLTGQTLYQAHHAVECYVQGDEGAAVGAALSDAHARLVAAIHQNRTLGNKVTQLAEQSLEIDLDLYEGGGRAALASISLLVDFVTPEGDPYTLI